MCTIIDIDKCISISAVYLKSTTVTVADNQQLINAAIATNFEFITINIYNVCVCVLKFCAIKRIIQLLSY